MLNQILRLTCFRICIIYILTLSHSDSQQEKYYSSDFEQSSLHPRLRCIRRIFHHVLHTAPIRAPPVVVHYRLLLPNRSALLAEPVSFHHSLTTDEVLFPLFPQGAASNRVRSRSTTKIGGPRSLTTASRGCSSADDFPAAHSRRPRSRHRIMRRYPAVHFYLSSNQE